MAETTKAYPLHWPPGWPRTQVRQRWPNAVSLDAALKECLSEMRLLGVTNAVLSSNCALGMSNAPDPGVVAYGLYEGLQIAVPCDRWTTVAANVRAIAKTINAMRGMERWGAKQMIRAMFQGFTAIAGPARPWRDILNLHETPITREMINERRRRLASTFHPDAGGSEARMAEINAAADEALREIG